jgi:hypothetical protein
MCEVTDEEAHFRSIVEVLGRRHRISGLAPESGTFELHDADRTVRVVLPPDLLAEYFTQLGERDIPDLPRSPREEQDRVRARHIIRSIEEIFESDIQLSLVAIQLDRSADGGISLVDRRGAARRSFPAANGEGGYWSSDRPGT